MWYEQNVAHEPQASVSLMSLPPFDVICDLYLNRHRKIESICLYNEQQSKISKITNLPRSARLFEDLFQFWYFSSRQENFSSRSFFFLFPASKQLLHVKLLSRPSLTKISQIFPKLCAMLDKTKKTIFSMTSAVSLFSDTS